MPEEVQHFTDLRVWRMAYELFLALLSDVDSFPATMGASVLAEQLIRSAASVSANTAEGFGRSQRKFASSLDIASGEASETESWLYKARDAGFLTPQVAAPRLRTIVDLEKMLGSLRRRILSNAAAVREEAADYLTGTNAPDGPEMPE